MNENHEQIYQILDKHDQRIRALEESDIKQQIQLANIEKSQSEIKLMINESSKEQQKTIRELLTAFTGQILENNKTENNIKFYNTKQFWVVLGIIATAIGTAIGHFFK